MKLLEDLGRKGIRIDVLQDKLKVMAPKGVLSQSLIALILEQKEEIRFAKKGEENSSPTCDPGRAYTVLHL